MVGKLAKKEWSAITRQVFFELLETDFSPWKLVEVSNSTQFPEFVLRGADMWFEREIGNMIWRRYIDLAFQPNAGTKEAIKSILRRRDWLLQQHASLIDRGRDALELRSNIIDEFSNSWVVQSSYHHCLVGLQRNTDVAGA